MEWRERIVEGFPPPYRGEPASLRRDIEDELADHLALATGREMARTGDEAAAHKAAVERFGNPRALARQLWFEAMKERIMKDRIMTVAMCLLAIAAILGGVFAYKAFEQSRQTSQAMIAALEKLAAMKQNETMTATETATATFKVVDEAGKPLEGVTVSLNGQPFTEKEEAIEVKTNAEGISEFGPVRMGKYTRRILTEEINSEGQIILYSGQDYIEDVKIPEIQEKYVKLDVGLTVDLMKSNLFFRIRLKSSFRLDDGDETYNIVKQYAVCSDGRIFDYLDSDQTYLTIGQEHMAGKIPFRSLPILVDALELFYVDENNHINSDSSFEYYKLSSMQKNLYTENPYNINIKDDQVKIDLNSTFINTIRCNLIGRHEKEAQDVDENLLSLIKNRVVGVRALEKDCTILSYMPEWNHGEVDWVGLANNDGGVRTLVKWALINSEDLSNSNRMYLLALYSMETEDDAFENIQQNEGEPLPQIFFHKIIEVWPERTSWKICPKYDETPVAEYAFEPGVGWKLFDVTSIVKKEASMGQHKNGLMFRFGEENALSGQGSWIGYHFASRENEDSSKRPVLLIVEPDEGERE